MVEKKIKDYSHLPEDIDEGKDFHVKGLTEEKLIYTRGGDNQGEFVCDMHNFGDSEDLPDSDRSMLSSRQQCENP